MKKPKIYSANSFNALKPLEKWAAYNALLNYAKELAKLASAKKAAVESKAEKIDYLKRARDELSEQLIVRNRAGAIARSSAYQERKIAVIAIYLELSEHYGVVTAPTVHQAFKNRYKGDKLSVRTVRQYINEYRQETK